jgi:predicted phosphodiesterase
VDALHSFNKAVGILYTMKYVIFSDIHSNLESLTLFIDDILPDIKPDNLFCLGDIVGYNPDPGESLSLVLDTLKPVIIRGNHDRAIGFNDFNYFSNHAKLAGKWSRNQLNQYQLDRLQSLEKGPKIIENLFVISHGSATDEDKYIFSTDDAWSEFLWLRNHGLHILFFGHTHIAGIFVYKHEPDSDTNASIDVIEESFMTINPNLYYCINPGALGQPRDGNPQASFALFDTKNMTVEIIRFNYPYTITQKKIYERNIPNADMLASRLSIGI